MRQLPFEHLHTFGEQVYPLEEEKGNENSHFCDP